MFPALHDLIPGIASTQPHWTWPQNQSATVFSALMRHTLSVAHQFLLNSHRCARRIQPRTIRMAERMPSDSRKGTRGRPALFVDVKGVKSENFVSRTYHSQMMRSDALMMAAAIDEYLHRRSGKMAVKQCPRRQLSAAEGLSYACLCKTPNSLDRPGITLSPLLLSASAMRWNLSVLHRRPFRQ